MLIERTSCFATFKRRGVILKILLLLCLFLVNSGIVAHAENTIMCYINPNGNVLYSNRKCPDGYFLVNGMLPLSNKSSNSHEAYTPIVPVESTVEAVPVPSTKKATPAKPKSEPDTFYDKNGNFTMIFSDGLSHGQKWGYFRQRYYGLYRCGSTLYNRCSCGCSAFSYRPRIACY